jgi:hypothetical protein
MEVKFELNSEFADNLIVAVLKDVIITNKQCLLDSINGYKDDPRPFRLEDIRNHCLEQEYLRSTLDYFGGYLDDSCCDTVDLPDNVIADPVSPIDRELKRKIKKAVKNSVPKKKKK